MVNEIVFIGVVAVSCWFKDMLFRVVFGVLNVFSVFGVFSVLLEYNDLFLLNKFD